MIVTAPRAHGWTPLADARLRAARERVRVLAAATPANAVEERARLTEAYARGEAVLPAWRYARTDLADVRRDLDVLEHEVTSSAGGDALAELYAARARELALEAALCEAVGTPALGPLAARRFGSFAPATRRRAEALATAWIRPEGEPVEAEPDLADVDTDDAAHAGSLLSRLRAEVARRRLPFEIVVHPPLAALAATGERTIYVAAGRRIPERAARRTVLHEIDGHAVPRHRGRSSRVGLFALGCARGSDDQEGYALWLESRHGFLDGARRHELAARSHAVRAMRSGAGFVDTVRHLHRDLGVPARRAVVVAERVFRGSHGSTPGLGREHVYLEALVRVREHLDRAPADEGVLGAGQVSLDAVAALAPFTTTTANTTTTAS